MEILFLGTGEACDGLHPNSSILLKNENSIFLFDCGFTVPHLFFNTCNEHEKLAGLWLSHFHGDHYFGVPLLLLRFYQDDRRKPFSILNGVKAQEKITLLMELAYPGLLAKLPFPLHFVEIPPGEKIVYGNLTWQTAECQHLPPAFGVRVSSYDKAIYYSGDGRPTSDSIELMRDADLVIHEAFSLDSDLPGHSSIAECLKVKREAGIKNMALIHMERDLRQKIELVHEYLAKESEKGILLPADGECVSV